MWKDRKKYGSKDINRGDFFSQWAINEAGK